MRVLLVYASLVLSFSSVAAVVDAAKLDASKKNILVEVSYDGGCATHNFSLQVGPCTEGIRVDCPAKLIETISGGIDTCEIRQVQTVVFNLRKNGLDAPYYSKGSLRISGSLTRGGGVSEATVILP